ncbi:DUF1513 domain-containing protein [Pelagibacterium halotolerans]|uniref:DUF1513 domain-containing protein n=1 Tax=Pelagibacterium halotolerans TaxID=531813 RepID=UPI00384BE414
MHSTAIDRRTFLALTGATLAPARMALAQDAADEALFIGARLASGGYEAAVIDAEGRDRLVLPLEARGHSFAIDAERRRAVAFARAPGRFAILFSLDGNAEPVVLPADPDRHYFGHGAFTADGHLLFATENDYDGERGVVGVYDVSGSSARIGEFATGGIGPHETLLMPDGKTLVTANGGILTHPDYDGIDLNIPEMKPSLVYSDITTGEITEKVELPPALHQLSIRHMAIDGAGVVWFGCQYQGNPSDRPPLVGRHRRGKEIELFSPPDGVLRRMDNYVGSVAVDRSGTILATSSPHGGLIAYWDTATGAYLGTQDLADGCGIAPQGPGVVLSTSGRGAIAETGPRTFHTIREADPQAPAWDNHLRRAL